MSRTCSYAFLCSFLIAFLFYGCDSDNAVTTILGTPDAVYTQSNQPSDNQLMMYSRAGDGTLTLTNTYSTGGTGTGMGLGSQGALTFNSDRSMIFVVNAGSNSISGFAVSATGVSLVSTTPSGGTMPISVTVSGDLLYVLNASGSGNITGFRINSDGTLSAIANSTANLSNNGTGSAPGPAEVQFNPSGTAIVVTEKGTSNILSYSVNSNGTVTGPTVNSAVGMTPFGFEFRNDNQIIVSEAFGGAVDSSAVSSYSLSGTNIGLISGPIFTTETAACWIAITEDRQYAYTTNTGSGSITGYIMNSAGVLTLLNSNGETGSTGSGSKPIDMAFSSGSNYLYTLNAGNSTISSFQVNGNGSLTTINMTEETGLPTGSAGLIAK
ncbi:MAG: beta-propeller fold lactonase family protein [Ignavibacteriae bacterium]|nr:beta-propeller fold lactonase family protein [Ignavibacteriota bacterium]